MKENEINAFVQKLKASGYDSSKDKEGKTFTALANKSGLDSAFVFDKWNQIASAMKKVGLKVEGTMPVKDSYSANEAVGTGAELAAVTKIIGKDKLEKFIEAGYKSEFIDHAQDELIEYYIGKKSPLNAAEGKEFYSVMSGRKAALDPFQWFHKRFEILSGKTMKENTERTIEFSAVLDTLPTDLQKGYRDMNPSSKEVLHSIISHMSQKKESISESRSLLKDAPATAEKSDTEKGEPLKKEEPKVEPEKKEEAVKEEPKATDEAEAIFTKKHYAPIAKILKSAKDKKEIVTGVAKLFKTQNEMFDEAKFINYAE